VVLAGVSAGAVCWFEGTVTDSWGEPFRPQRDGLGLLPGWLVPHNDGEPARRTVLEALIGAGDAPGAWVVDDGAALCFADGALVEIVTSRPAAGAGRVERAGDRAVTRALPVRYLGPG
jgi:dipeptidase E